MTPPSGRRVSRPSHNKAIGARVPGEKSSGLIPLTAGARAGTTFLHRVRAPPKKKGSAGPVHARRESGTL